MRAQFRCDPRRSRRDQELRGDVRRSIPRREDRRIRTRVVRCALIACQETRSTNRTERPNLMLCPTTGHHASVLLRQAAWIRSCRRARATSGRAHGLEPTTRGVGVRSGNDLRVASAARCRHQGPPVRSLFGPALYVRSIARARASHARGGVAGQVERARERRCRSVGAWLPS